MRQERECGIESLTAEDALVDPVREEYPRRSHQLVGRVFLVAAVVANEFHSYDLKERDQYTNISYWYRFVDVEENTVSSVDHPQW